MEMDTFIDYASFLLSPKRTRCELFVTTDGKTEKLASGLVKPFVIHLKAVEEQVASTVNSIKLEVLGDGNAKSWFTKGTLERFVRFVSTPEVMELVNTHDAELSQLESARRIYSQGIGSQLSGSDDGLSSDTVATDATKKELLRAIDVRLATVQQDLMIACSRATAAGFNLDTVAKLQMFSDQFGAHRLNEACSKFISLCKKRPNLINQWKACGAADGHAVRSSYGSDMSLDEDPSTPEQQCAMMQPNSQDSGTMHQQPPPLLDQSSASVNQILKPSSADFHQQQSSGGPSIESEEKSSEKNDFDQTEQTPTSRQIRRLSVQDRINMFENKQKENSGGGGKPIVGKSVELRRLPVAPSLVGEKAISRRWSGASDMSIDLSTEMKDVESPLFTPSSAYASKSKHEDQAKSGFTDMEQKLADMEFQSVPDQVSDIRMNEHEDLKLHVQDSNAREESKQLSAPYKKVEDSQSINSKCNYSIAVEKNGQKDSSQKTSEKTKSHLNSTRTGKSLKERPEAQGLFGSLPWDKPRKVGVAIQGNSTGCQGSDGTIGANKRAVHESAITALNRNSFLEQYQTSASLASKDNATHHIVHHSDEEGSQLGDELMSKSQYNAPQNTKVDFGSLESGSISRAFLTPQAKGVEGGSSYSESRLQPSVEIEEAEKEKFVSAGVVAEEEGSMSLFTTPVQQVRKIRQSKGNQELNDELQNKANELEKLFAEHKQRAPGDHSNPTRKSRLTEMPAQEQAGSLYTTHVRTAASVQLPDKYMVTDATVTSSSCMVNCDNNVTEVGDNKGCTDVLNENFSEFSALEGSRGKLYVTYMQIRDAKLREEWNSKRDEKEAKLKAMQESLEKTRDKMKAKFSGSSYKDDSLPTAHRRADRLKSFDTRSILRREKQQLDFDQHEDEVTEICNQEQYGERRYSSERREALFEDDVSRSNQTQKLLPAIGPSSSSPRPSAAPVIRSAAKATTSNPGRRRSQIENPLAQSVPNFSDLKKETRASTTVGKTARSQLKNYARNKRISEETPIKEDLSCRSQFLRKSTSNQGAFGEASVIDCEDGSTFENDEMIDKVGNNVAFHKGKSENARVSFQKQRRFIGSQNMNSDGNYNDAAVHDSDSPIALVKDRDGMFENSEHISNLGNVDSILTHESGKSAGFGSENDDNLLRSFSHFDPPLDSAEQLQDRQSPVSWNSCVRHQFSYSNEMSNVEAYVDSSPLGSPPSWNSHSLKQTEAYAARMRKMWGAAQKPVLVAGSHNQPRKDMTKGFKRLLKFGRKHRGAENLVDWISATTSEGDDDLEDGRDPANRTSDDMRKSRMGHLQGQPSDDNSFNEQESFAGQLQSIRGSIPAPPANFKLRDDHLSGSSSLKDK
ncbi:unnamed protein product [Cuscuta campestris]|uniref:COP1-interacting protein 7 n=1 Tax=Cuscuta campestris TaxID=132261 RepID=A0A484LWZ6_9ASTE|nr:unnamed protein product [Cuscuta campestris]